MTPPLLEARSIVKRFPGVVALSGVSFDLRAGEVHALCGENGAGKSTLIKVLSGVHPHGSYEGDILISGAPARFATVRDAERVGIAVIHQELSLVPGLTVAENLFLGREPRRFGLVDWDRLLAHARTLLEEVGSTLDPETPIERLPVGEQQRVEIARAIGKRSRALILDEPTAALSKTEADGLLALVRRLRAQGIGCIYISHRLDEVFALADRITVLRDGKSIVTLDGRGAERSEVIRHMVGRPIHDLFPRRSVTPGETVLRVDDLTVSPPSGEAHRLSKISFEVRAGEVLGIGGLMGAGRTELLLHLFGAYGVRRGGRVELHGRPFAPRSPHEAIAAGLALVSEDRKRYGLVLEQSIAFNLSLSSLSRLRRFGLVDRSTEEREERALASALRIRARDIDVPVKTLSGGNQQKVVIGKALLTEPRVLLFDEPTRGVDVGAKVELYELINHLTAEGKAVVLVSSELPELLGMSDRIVMLREGTLGGTFERSEATQENMMAAATGAAHAV